MCPVTVAGSLPQVQERLEASGAGRLVISALVVAVVACIVASSLPGGSLRRSVERRDRALLAVTGLDQRWDIFAPEPRLRVVEVRARITSADGRVEEWRPPLGPPVIGAYWDHRWRKWVDNAMRAGPRSPLWRWLAAWLARERSEGGFGPQSVTVVGRYYDLRPPGAEPLRGPWRELVVYRGTGAEPTEVGIPAPAGVRRAGSLP